MTCDEIILSHMYENWMKSQLVSDNSCHPIIYNPLKHSQGMRNNVWVAFIVGITTPRFTISLELRQLELVTLNIIFSVDHATLHVYKVMTVKFATVYVHI